MRARYFKKDDKRYDLTAVRGSHKKKAFETNDCTVRACMNFLDISYDEAHEICEEAGRRNRDGWYPHTILLNLQQKYGYQIEKIKMKSRTIKRVSPTSIRYGWAAGDKDEWVLLYPTLAAFLRENPVGKFWVCTQRHALVVKDGVVYDSNQTSMRGRICEAYRLVD